MGEVMERLCRDLVRFCENAKPEDLCIWFFVILLVVVLLVSLILRVHYKNPGRLLDIGIVSSATIFIVVVFKYYLGEKALGVWETYNESRKCREFLHDIGLILGIVFIVIVAGMVVRKKSKK